MIAELEEFEPAEARRILNRIAASLLPNPGIEAARPVFVDESAGRVLRSLRNRLVHGNPKDSDGRLLALVAEELSGRYLTDEKKVEVRARLGNRGELEPGQYDVIFNPELDIVGKLFAIKRSDIKEALYQPDAVQLITAKELNAPEGRFSLMSLRIKRHRVHSAEAHSLFIHCVHQDEKLTVWQAWRIYDSDVKVDPGATPLDAFRAFVEAYGAGLVADDVSLHTNFILYEVFSPRNPSMFNLVSENPGGGEAITRIAIMKTSELATVEVAFAYAIKVKRYLRDLAKHGLPVDRSGAALTALNNRVFTHTFD